MKFATLIAAVLSVLAIGSLLLSSKLPVFPGWTGPAHFSSSVVLALAFAAVLATWLGKTTVEIAWLTLLSGSALVVLLEVLQQVNPVRSFQLEDILFGVAGISAGAIVAYLLISLIGKIRFAAFTIVSTVAVGVFLVYFSTKSALVSNLSCGVSTSTAASWDAVLFDDFSQKSGVATSDKLQFCVAQNNIVASNDISYDADLRISLDGFADAVREHRRFVMGIQFETAQQHAFSEIFSLTWAGTANRYFARFHRSAKHLVATLQFNAGERTVSSLANRVVEPKKVQELFMIYDGKQQTTWLNGEIVSTEVNYLNPPSTKNTELVLNIRQTADRKSWVPFEGNIRAIYLGTRVVSDAEIQSIFSD